MYFQLGRVQTYTDFDALIRKSLEGILGGPLSDWSWLKLRVLSPVLWGDSTFGVLPFMLQQLFLDSSVLTLKTLG